MALKGSLIYIWIFSFIVYCNCRCCDCRNTVIINMEF